MDIKLPISNLERQELLLNFVKLNQRATVAQISEKFSVSVATVRRDLEALAERGEIERFHGGAKVIRQAPPEPPALQRSREQAEEKKQIGRAAAALIEEGETVFLGSGTTVLEVARHLRERHKLTVITNSLLVINALADLPDFTLVHLGGIVRHSEMSTIGHLTEQALAEVNARKIVLGIHALDIEYGLTNENLPEAMTDRAILARRGQIIIVADHTKCGRISTAFVAPISVIHKLVTDSQTPPDFIDALQAKGIEVLVV
ncbi:MAG: DeoR/GlpR family DNA-binding transcription regulator [Anaerolineae bacterium]|nr:DeoR/GlpR family DNA-binding transcription regulator [Anaerolineae bacterium]